MNRRKFLSLFGLAGVAGAFPVAAFAAHGMARGGRISYPLTLAGERGPEFIVPNTRFDVGLESVDKRIRDAAPVIVKHTVRAIEEARARDVP